MRQLVAVLRVAAGVAGLTAVAATFIDTASRVPINPFNFFGYFTLQSNIITAIVMIVAGLATFRARRQSSTLVLARACVTTYIAIVGIVYNTLLVGTEGGGGVSLPWANFMLHVAIPIYVVLDWILFADRPAVPWRRFGVVLIYPIVWIVVVLIRGATDGWFPYPFLDPALGYGVVALYCVGIAVAIGVLGAAVWGISRLRTILVR